MITYCRIRRAGALEIDLIDREELLDRVEDRLVNHVVPVYTDKFKSKILAGYNLGRLVNNVAGSGLSIASDLKIDHLTLEIRVSLKHVGCEGTSRNV